MGTIVHYGNGSQKTFGMPISASATVTVGGIPTTPLSSNYQEITLATAPGNFVKVEITYTSYSAGAATGGVSTGDLSTLLAAIAAIPAPGASSGGAVSGEVREFAFGAIPVGYTQLSNTPITLAQPTGTFDYKDVRGLSAVTPNLSGWTMGFTVGESYAIVGSATSGASSVTFYTKDWVAQSSTPVPVSYADSYSLTQSYSMLSNLFLLRIGGRSSSSTFTQNCQLFNMTSKVWTTIAPMPAAQTTVDISTFCEHEASLCVYGQYVTGNVAQFNVGTNTWNATFDTAPTSGIPSVTKLPSGILLFGYANAQYMFNPNLVSGSRWTQVGSESGIGLTQATFTSTFTGLRAYAGASVKMGATAQLTISEYHEASNTWSSYKQGSQLFGGSGVRPSLCQLSPEAYLLTNYGSFHALTHITGQARTVTVKAKKD